MIVCVKYTNWRLKCCSIIFVVGALAIGITCNFVNENTMAEAGVEEISGVAYQYNPRFFEDLYEQFGVRLENIVYYKDETHYFVMTALKSSLLAQGVCKQVNKFSPTILSIYEVP